MDELDKRVRHTETQLSELAGHVKRHGDILSDHGGKLDKIIQAVSGATKFDPLKIMQFIVFALAIASVGGTVIVYVASSTNASRIAVLEFQTREVWGAGQWYPKMPGVKGDAIK